jgi:heptaprenyl diphosphate synthase
MPSRGTRTSAHAPSGKQSAMAAAELAHVLSIPSLAKDLGAVDQRVSGALKEFRKALGGGLFDALAAPAKRVRPTMTIACARLGGDKIDKRVATAGAAIELVQIGSLIHDDVLEEAPTRRGRPTLNATEGVPVAVVVGDLVLARAGMLAAELGEEPSELLSESMAEMCVGQLAELRDAFNIDRTMDAYLASLRGKTGALFAAACRVGGLMGGMSGRALDAVTAYGGAFGVIYQMVDDVLDLTGDPKKLGKPVGMDIAAGVYTAPVIGALKAKGGKVLARLLIGAAESDLVEATKKVLASGALEDVEGAIYSLADDASKALEQFGPDPIAAGLRRFPRYYVDWAFSELRAKRWTERTGAEQPVRRATTKAKSARRANPKAAR